jgi:predicted phage terminase large subunit-like protein
MVSQLRERARAAGVNLYLYELRHTSDKKGRIETLEPLISQGRLRFSRRQSVLLEQLRQFPLGAHDDGPDALHMVVAAVMRPGGGEWGRVSCPANR